MVATTVVVSTPYPPQGAQVTALQTSGTIMSVGIPQPVLTNESSVIPAYGQGPRVTGGFAGRAALDISVYDASTSGSAPPYQLGTPLATIKSANGYEPTTLNLAFTKGIFIVCRSGSDVQVVLDID